MNILSSFKSGINKSSHYISNSIRSIIKNNTIDENILHEIENILISADIGVEASGKLVNEIKKKKSQSNISLEELIIILAGKLEKILKNHEKALEIYNKEQQIVLSFVGVNGSGKTTTIGKLAKKLSENNKVLIAACDTFRAAAVDQIRKWSKLSAIELYEGTIQQDPASVAYEACQKFKNEKFQVLLVDTAGRLSNNKNLMEQLSKIKRTINKSLNNSIQLTFLVLDGSTGSNILNQFEKFNDLIGIDGLIVTKLDGTAKGGGLISIVSKYEVPIYFVGMGEKVEDLHEFKAKEFAFSLFNLDNNI